MDKDELRPVEYHYAHQTTSEAKKGWLHHWITQKDDDGSEHTRGIVETEDGKVVHIEAANIRFLDRQKPPVKKYV